MLRQQKILRIRAHLYIEPAAMTGGSAAPITAAVRVVDNIKHVWYVVVDVIASGSSLRSFGGTFSKRATNC